MLCRIGRTLQRRINKTTAHFDWFVEARTRNDSFDGRQQSGSNLLEPPHHSTAADRAPANYLAFAIPALSLSLQKPPQRRLSIAVFRLEGEAQQPGWCGQQTCLRINIGVARAAYTH